LPSSGGPGPESVRVTIVVPTRNAARTLERCLASIRTQSYSDAELVVVDNSSADATPEIAARYADHYAVRGPERSAQENYGWRAGTGAIVGFIDADMVLEPEVVREAVSAFDGDPGLGALVIPELAFGDGFFARCRALEKRARLGDAGVEAARLFRRSVLEQVGGYDEALTAFEDWDLADRVTAAGYRIGRVSSLVWHDEGRLQLRGAYRKWRYYGRWLPAYRARPSARSRSLSRFLGSVLEEGPPRYVAGLIVLKAVEAAGMIVGAAEGRWSAGARRRGGK